MAIGFSINGKKLHETRIPMEPHTPGVNTSLSFPKSRIVFSLKEDKIHLTIPPLLALNCIDLACYLKIQTIT